MKYLSFSIVGLFAAAYLPQAMACGTGNCSNASVPTAYVSHHPYDSTNQEFGPLNKMKPAQIAELKKRGLIRKKSQATMTK